MRPVRASPIKKPTSLWQKIPVNRRQLFSETARFGDGFELPVDILHITLLSDANIAHDYYVLLGISSVDDVTYATPARGIPGALRAEGKKAGIKESTIEIRDRQSQGRLEVAIRHNRRYPWNFRTG